MGRNLYETHDRFKFWMDHCDDLLHPMLGTSMLDILYGAQANKHQAFDNISYTNPALLTIEYSLAQILQESGIEPDYLLGYSLGEFSSSVFSGVLPLQDALTLSIEIAELVEQHTQQARMLAIIDSTEIIQEFHECFTDIWLIAQNFDRNFVVSGPAEKITALQNTLIEKGKISQILPVNYGFHTPFIDPIEQQFKQFFQNVQLSSPTIATFSSATSQEVTNFNEDYFWQIIRKPVNFEKIIKTLADRDDYIFVDVGPSGTLATFVKYLLPKNSGCKHVEMINQFGDNQTSLAKLQAILASNSPIIQM